jgi:hypothetical protein
MEAGRDCILHDSMEMAISGVYLVHMEYQELKTTVFQPR